VTPNWCISYPDCWRHIVQKWCSEEWEENHVACRERRLMMPGVAHHQGSRNLSGYAEAWVRTFISSNTQLCMLSNHLSFCCFSRSHRHMVASLAISSRHLLCPTRERRPPTLAITRRTGPRHTAMRAFTPASVTTHRWQERSMAQNMIPPQSILTQRSS
jgi:hypothetical protein